MSYDAMAQWIAAAAKSKADTAVQPGDLGTAAFRDIDTIAPIEADYARTYAKEIVLANIPGLAMDASVSGSLALSALQSEHAASGFIFRMPQAGKLLLDADFVLNSGQRLAGNFVPNDATGVGYDYSAIGSSVRLSSGATIRLDNGGTLDGLLIYRQGLVFNADQGDFSSWTGNGVVLGYGNDQVIRNCMVLGFDTCIAPLAGRGLSGSGRVVLDHVYVDGRNGFRLVGSYDTALIDRIKAFAFVTQAYAGSPHPDDVAAGINYDPRKDRRPGVGFQMLDRADGTKIGTAEIFGYTTNFDANTSGWSASQLTSDYPTTPVYNSGGSGVVGVHLRADVDPTGPRVVDYDPSQIGNLQIWSSDIGLKIEGSPGRVAQIGQMSIVNAYGDAIQIDGGGLRCANIRIGNCTGAPVNFLSAPSTRSYLRGRANNFGAGRNSDNVPAVKLPAGANANLIEVILDTDQSLGSSYFDNHPVPPSVASADPLILPAFSGMNSEVFTVTGTDPIAFIYGPRPGRLLLYFVDGLTLFAGAATGGIRLPGGAASLAMPAGSNATIEFNGATLRWVVTSYQI